MNLYNYLVNIRTLEIEKRTLEQSMTAIIKKMNSLGIRSREPNNNNPITDNDRNLTGGKVLSILIGVFWGGFGIYCTSIAPQFFWTQFFIFLFPHFYLFFYRFGL